MNPERLSIISPRLRSFVDKGVMAGAVVLIARRGEIVMLEAVGYQDIHLSNLRFHRHQYPTGQDYC